ncbi:MAG: DNA translocase FtsK 4TM domain-containing protein [bacterium]|nr:DNA translocase FtsK 4TM domain-containing protein [bacterium]
MARREENKRQFGKKFASLLMLQNLKRETRRAIGAVVFLTLSLIMLLAGFEKAGIAGQDLYKIFAYLLGIGYFLLPALCFVLSLSLFEGDAPDKESGHRILGGSLFFVSSLSLLQLSKPGEAGVVGKMIGGPLLAFFDFYASSIIVGALLLISLLILFEFPLGLSSIKLTGKNIWLFLKNSFGKKSGEMTNDKKIEEVVNSAIAGSTPLNTSPITSSQVATEETDVLEEKNAREKDSENQDPSFTKSLNLFPLLQEEFIPPPLSILEVDRGKPGVGDIKANANIIKRTLQNFGIAVEMDEISIGPAVTRYAIKPAEGVRLQKIVALQQNLELALAAHPIRIEAPIPGKSLVGLEVPNNTKSIVGLGSMFGSDDFKNSDKPLLVALGRGITGKSYFGNIAKMPHLLIAGSTGSGKSVMIHGIITSLLFRNSPENLRLIMIDPKRVELTLYNSIPHLLNPVITDAKKAILALKWAAKEMDRRYDILESEHVRDIDSYHKTILAPALSKIKNEGKPQEGSRVPEMMPYICIFIDELADIMSTFPRELEAAIVRLAQMSRAVGIHLILSTQRPSVNIITGLIKANIPARIALQVASQIDSRTILDMGGAEKLLGAGDMLYLSAEMSQPQRMQAPFMTETEVKKITKYLIKAGEHIPPSEINLGGNGESNGGGLFAGILEDNEGDIDDDLYEEAREEIVKAGRASTSYLQRRLRIGYARAARIMDLLEEHGVIGAGDGAKPREVLIKNEGETEGMGVTEENKETL